MAPLNDGRPYADQIKPFNFAMIAFVDLAERPADEDRLVLLAPYDPDPTTWPATTFVNRFNGNTYRITTRPSEGLQRPGLVTVKTYRDILTAYTTHPETKSADHDGAPCNRRTIGLLDRRHITAHTITHIGKEAHRLDDARLGLTACVSDSVAAYDDPNRLALNAALPRLQELGTREVARRTGFAPSTVHAVLSGRTTPRPEAVRRYIAAV